MEAYCIKNKEAVTVASKFIDEFVLRFGIPRAVATDMGTEFTAEVFSQVCKTMGIEKIVTTPYHHQSVGALENSHRQLGSYLKIMTSKCPNNWSNWVPYWTFSHNNTVHSATGYAPAELVFGKLTNLPSNLGKSVDPIYNFDSYVNELKYRLQVAWTDAKETLLENKARYKIYYDKTCNDKMLKIGDKVLLLNNARKNKLQPYYSGPYVVTKLELPNLIINILGVEKRVHINNIRKV